MLSFQKRTLYLLGWLFMVGMFTFPEAGLVLFMTFHFWVCNKHTDILSV